MIFLSKIKPILAFLSVYTFVICQPIWAARCRALETIHSDFSTQIEQTLSKGDYFKRPVPKDLVTAELLEILRAEYKRDADLRYLFNEGYQGESVDSDLFLTNGQINFIGNPVVRSFIENFLALVKSDVANLRNEGETVLNQLY